VVRGGLAPFLATRHRIPPPPPQKKHEVDRLPSKPAYMSPVVQNPVSCHDAQLESARQCVLLAPSDMPKPCRLDGISALTHPTAMVPSIHPGSESPALIRQLLHDRLVRIHPPIHAVRRTRTLRGRQAAALDRRGYAFLPADGRQVGCHCWDVSPGGHG
jgi:hypothetical protein